MDYSDINEINNLKIDPYKYASKFDNVKRYLAWTLAGIQGFAIPIIVNYFGNILNYFVAYNLNHQMKTITKINEDNILKELVECLLVEKPNTASFEKKYPTIDINTIKNDIKNSSYANYKLGEHHEFLTIDTISDGLNKYFLRLMIVAIASFIISFTFIYLLNNVASNITIKIRSLIYKSLLKKTVEWHEDKRNVKEYALDINSNLTNFEKGIGPNSGFYFLFDSIFLICLIMAFSTGTKLSFFLLLILILRGGIIVFIINKIQSHYISRIVDVNSDISQYVYKKTLPIIKTITSYGVVDKDFDWIFTYDKGYFIRKTQCIGILSGLEILMSIFFPIVFCILGGKYINDNSLSAGEVIQVYLYFISLQFAKSCANICDSKYIKSQQNIRYIDSILGKSIINESFSTKNTSEIEYGDIEFNNVHFTYPNGPKYEALKGVTFSCQAGKKIAIVDEQYSGKSTIFQLLKKQYKYEYNNIKIDDIPISSYNYSFNQIGFIGKEPILFGGMTIGENIAIVNPNASQAEIEDAARLANAHDFITKLPHGYKTRVFGNNRNNKNKANLSNGQKQLICIARALLMNPKILLIDEALIDLESPYKELAQSALESAVFNSQRTCLIITNNIDTLKKVDNIIVMNDGIVAESGTHDELIAKHTIYYDFIQCGKIGNEQINQSNNNDNNNLSPISDNVSYNNNFSVDSKTALLNKDQNNNNNLEIHINYNSINNNNAKFNLMFNNDNNNISRYHYSSSEYEEDEYLKKNKFIPWKDLFIYYKSSLLANTLSLLASIVNGLNHVLKAFIFAGILNIFCIQGKDLIKETKHYYLLIIIFYVIVSLCFYIMTSCNFYSGRKLKNDINKYKFRSLLKQEVAYIETDVSKDLSKYKDDDSEDSFSQKDKNDNLKYSSFSFFMNGMIIALMYIISLFIFAYYSNVKLFYILVGFAPIIIFVNYSFIKISNSNYSKKRILYDRHGKFIIKRMQRFKTIHDLNAQEYFYKVYDRKLKKQLRYINFKNIIFGIGAALIFAIPPSICLIGFKYGYQYLEEGSINIENMFKVISAVIYAYTSIFLMYPNMDAIYSFIDVFKKDIQIINRQSKIDGTNPNNGIKDIELKGKITFKNNVCFNTPIYPDIPVLHLGFNEIEIPENKSVVIIGGPDSGKSELLQLIPRIYDIQQGEILIDDQLLTDYNIRWLRKQISYIESEPKKYDESYGNNILEGRKDATEEEVKEAAKKAGVHDYIMSLPSKYMSCEASYSKLKDCHKQGMAIARALLREPRILLIDNIVQGLSDNESKVIIQDILNSLILNYNHERTMIITSDYLFSTIDKVDIIMVMKEGKIIEKGSHSELMALKGEYYNMTLQKEIDNNNNNNNDNNDNNHNDENNDENNNNINNNDNNNEDKNNINDDNNLNNIIVTKEE
ncbi:P-loop containing nucleoside triphosphate hydrolase protein [Anaeromyces robustus]|uniref:p-loop containing nucleoside triphosphate hydrolase protein n=1 Tax=Anaeromyces robustus TaxID=1754192 RepID=A0A1Y1WV87_9FUNG|nr:P-loop containing nucleoside triphosphate hydrolase protein [Anaeromyces robustus]|eukprot:ORX77460.1 P-loop containing nucleoside triphosphate hydrolase protein [Anaeromyces robustus]